MTFVRSFIIKDPGVAANFLRIVQLFLVNPKAALGQHS